MEITVRPRARRRLHRLRPCPASRRRLIAERAPALNRGL